MRRNLKVNVFVILACTALSDVKAITSSVDLDSSTRFHGTTCLDEEDSVGRWVVLRCWQPLSNTRL